MKILAIISLLFLTGIGHAENRQTKVDSLQLVLMHAHEDTNNVLTRLELSNQLYTMDEYELALEHAILAQELAQKLSFNSGIASSYRRMGAIYTEQGKYSQGLDCYFKSLSSESSANYYALCMINNGIGNIYYFQGDYERALQYYFKAYNHNESDALTCGNIGMAYADKGDYLLSLNYFFKALDLYEFLGDKNGIALMLNNIGAVYEYQMDYTNALEYYFSSLKIKTELQDNQGICDALAGIGDIYFHQKKYTDALKYEQQSLMLAKQIGYISSIKQTEEVLSNIYFQLGDFSKSLHHYKEFSIAKDSLFNEENTKRMVGAEKDFEFQKRDEHNRMEQSKKDAVQAEQFKAQKFQRNVFIIAFILLAIFLIIGFRGYKKIQQANIIIAEQKKIVEHKNKEVTDNINYAQRIQQAMLPSTEFINTTFPENFLIYRPKDIVSGDFYWAHSDESWNYFITADCTGHGVSGAMMSMIGTALLNEIVIERKIKSPDLILNALRDEIIKSLNKQGASEERKDGMDISCCRVSKIGRAFECASANNPVYIIRGKDVIELKANRFPVGKHIGETAFTLNVTLLQPSDIIYTMSDGFCDQFGGDKGKKLMSKRFKEWAVELAPLKDMNLIKQELENRFNNWIGTAEQIDDVTIFSIKF